MTRAARSLLLLLALAGCDGATPPPDDAGDAGYPRAPPGFRVRFEARGTLAIEAAGVSIAGVEVVLHLPDGPHPLSSMSRSREGDTTVTGRDGATTLRVALSPTPRGAVEVAWRVEGAGAVHGVALEAPAHGLPDDARGVMDGAQSWSFAGTLPLAPGAVLPRDARGAIVYPASLGDPLADVAGMSLFRGDLVWEMGGLSACAAPPFDRWTALAFERPDARWRWTLRTGLRADEAASLTPGASYEGRWVLAQARPDAAFACAEALSSPARTRGDRPFPRGWWSWNTLFERVTAAQVEAQVDPLRALDPAASLVTVDDGWERAWGDWRERDGFGSTLSDLAARLRARGVALGLWLAPFAVDPAAPLVREHPDWLVRDAGGAPLAAPLVPGRTFHVLDATVPAVRSHLTALFRDLRARGVTLFKIDFLYAGALPGVRADATRPPLVAYRLGLDAIAAGAGDAHLNGCGAPVLPSLAAVDSMRVGADNTYATARPFWAAVVAAARNLAARSDVTRLGVAPDPDQPVTRDLPPEEARAFLAMAALSGGAFGYGDDLTALDAERRALYREAWFTRLRDRLRAPARPLDAGAGGRFVASPLIDGAMTGFRSTRTTAPAAWAATLGPGETDVVLFNWGEAEAVLDAPAELVGTAARELVAGAPVTREGSRWRVRVPPHAVRVLSSAR